MYIYALYEKCENGCQDLKQKLMLRSGENKVLGLIVIRFGARRFGVCRRYSKWVNI